MLKIRRHMITKSEMVEAMEYFTADRLRHYIYSYKVMKGRKWITLVRWDNLDGMDHMDRYDENGNFIESREFPRRSFEDLVKIIKTFRRNIIAMDVDNL